MVNQFNKFLTSDDYLFPLERHQERGPGTVGIPEVYHLCICTLPLHYTHPHLIDHLYYGSMATAKLYLIFQENK